MRTLGTKIRELAQILLCALGLSDVLFMYVQKERGVMGQFCEVIGGTFGANCEEVLTSQFSQAAGLDLTIWGILYYLSLLWISIWIRFEGPNGGRASKFFLSGISGTGFAVSLYLTYLQARVIGSWCPFCLVSAGITTLIFVLSLFGLRKNSGTPAAEETSGGTGALVLLCVILSSALAVSMLAKSSERGKSALEEMVRFVPRRTALAGGLQLGNDSAPVTVQAFLDYTCPHCRTFESTVFPKIKSGYIDPGRVKWLSKLLPHSDQGAPIFFAMAGICARDMPDSASLDRAFFNYPTNSPKTGFDALADAVLTGGLDTAVADSITRCVQTRSPELQQKVLVEVNQAFSYGLRGPPAFVIDGIAFQGTMDYRTMADLLETFLKHHGQ